MEFNLNLPISLKYDKCKTLRTASATHSGRRKDNEDGYLIREFSDGRVLLVVADGMGGHAGGTRAAAEAIEALRQCEISKDLSMEDLGRVIRKTNERIWQIGEKTPELEGLGTTLTAALVSGSSLFWAHVGDSRLYVLHAGMLQQVTVDQTLVQGLFEEGVITAEEKWSHPLRHMLDQCVGCPECVPEFGKREIFPEDLILLSTDGLHDVLKDTKIQLLLREIQDLEDAARELIRETLKRGGTDNITVVLARADRDVSNQYEESQ
jgi:PPM family protein phosphatase